MEERLKQRLVGAMVLVALAVIFVPMLLDVTPEPDPLDIEAHLPEDDEAGFRSGIVPLDEPATPILDEAARMGEESIAGGRSEAGEEAPVAAVPPPVDAADGGGDAPPVWAVQVGSFSRRENAFVLQNRLLVEGHAAFTESAKGEEGEITRVLVGPEPEHERAQSIAHTLARELGLEGIVVRRSRKGKD